MVQITGGGAFTRQNITDINNNFLSVTKPDLWVRPQYGVNATATGTYEKPFATMTAALSSPLLRPGMTIGLLGVLFENATGPIVNDIRIVGMGDTPRQATTSGAPNGGGATWLSPTSGGTAFLLAVQGQAWTIQNIYFNNSVSSSSATAAIEILTTGDPPASADGAHALIQGCIFTGANGGAGTTYGVYASGGTNFVNIDGCTFFNFAGTGETAIGQTTGAGIATLLGWKVTNNTFYNNVNGVVVPSTCGFYIGNTFVSDGASVTATTLLSLTSGTKNVIYNNKFGLASDASGIATIVAMGTSPSAGPNFYNDVTEYGQPAE